MTHSHTPPSPPSLVQVFFLADIFGSPVFSFNTTEPVVWFPQANGTSTEFTLDVTDNEDGTYSYNLYITGGSTVCTTLHTTHGWVSAGLQNPEGAPEGAHATQHGHCRPHVHSSLTHVSAARLDCLQMTWQPQRWQSSCTSGMEAPTSLQFSLCRPTLWMPTLAAPLTVSIPHSCSWPWPRSCMACGCS